MTHSCVKHYSFVANAVGLFYTKQCKTLQHTAAHCSTLQHTAAHCSTLQHTSSVNLRRLFDKGPTSLIHGYDTYIIYMCMAYLSFIRVYGWVMSMCMKHICVRHIYHLYVYGTFITHKWYVCHTDGWVMSDEWCMDEWCPCVWHTHHLYVCSYSRSFMYTQMTPSYVRNDSSICTTTKLVNMREPR